MHLNALDSVFGPYNLFQEGFYEFHRRRRNSAGNVPRRNFMVSNIISPGLLPIKSRIAVCFKCIYILPTGLLCIFLYLRGCRPQGKISRRPIYFAFASNRPIFAIYSILLREACLIREGVKKNRLFLGKSPKQRTPPTNRYSLGLT